MARFENGWFKVHREAWTKDLGQNMFLWGIWHALLHMATWKETQIIWEGKQRTLPPGSVIFGIKELSDKWEVSRSVIKKWLHYLHDTQRIVLESCPRGTLAIICNWELYQENNPDACPQRDHNETTTSHQRDNNEPLIEEGKKVRKKEIVYTAEFETIWKLMPEGIKQKAFKAFRNGMKKWDHKTPDQISAALTNYLADCVANNRFKMHLSSFIGSDRTTHPWFEFIEPRAAPPPPAGTLPASLNITCTDCRNGLIRAINRSSGASSDLACRCAKGKPKQNAYGVFDESKFERVA